MFCLGLALGTLLGGCRTSLGALPISAWPIRLGSFGWMLAYLDSVPVPTYSYTLASHSISSWSCKALSTRRMKIVLKTRPACPPQSLMFDEPCSMVCPDSLLE